MPEYNSTIAEWKSDAETGPELDPHKSPLTLYKGPEHIVKGAPDEMNEAFKHLEDGRMYFAVDTKKIYVDCDFETSDGEPVHDRISFGGNNGIFYGRKTFDPESAAVQSGEYWFIPELGDLEDNRDDIPQVDDLILNSDGCFYRVSMVRIGTIDVNSVDDEGNPIVVPSEEMYTILETTKLTIAGSGNGGGGSVASSVVKATKMAGQPTTFIKAKNSLPFSFKVTDSDENITDVSVEIYINDRQVGSRRVPVSEEYQTLDLKTWINQFQVNTNINYVTLRFRDDHNATDTLYIRGINVVDLEIRLEDTNLGRQQTSSFPIKFYPYGGTSMYSWKVKGRLSPPGQGNAIVREMVTTADKGQEEIWTVSGLDAYGEGQYTIDFWIEAYPDADSEVITSPVVTASFWYASASSSTVGVNMALVETTGLTQYGSAVIQYTVVASGSKSNVHLKAVCDGVDVVNTYSNVNNNINLTWTIPLDLAGTYTFSIGLDDFNYENSITNIEVAAPDVSVPVIDPTDPALQLYLSAKGKSNDNMNKNSWTWNNITSDFSNFNWNTNGWLTDDNGQTSLHLSNGAKLKINFAPFALANTNNQGAQSTGKTIEFDFKLSNVRNSSGIFINAASWDPGTGKIYCGIVGQGDRISMNTPNLTNYRTLEEDLVLSEEEKAMTNGLRAYVTEDERVNVAFVIQAAGEDPAKTLIYVYINGVLSGLTNYEGETLRDYDRNNPAYIEILSDSGDIDIYNIRVYSKKFTDDNILKNYAADRPTSDERLAVTMNNDALDTNGEISLDMVKALGNIPYVVFTDCRQVKDKKAGYKKNDPTTYPPKFVDQTTGKLPTSKKDFRWTKFYYVDPLHEGRNIGSVNNKATGVIYGQGTSSMNYPVKNIRLRIREVTEDGTKQDKYSVLPSIPIENLDSSNPELKAAAELEQEYWANIPGARVFTFKADYMDSSMAHNTGTGNVLAALYKSIDLQSPTQKYYDNETICTNVVGTPCLAFFVPYGQESQAAIYIGRYNFNTDKSEHDIFGFVEDAQLDDNGVIQRAFGRAVTGGSAANWYQGARLKRGFHGTTDEEYEGTPEVEEGEEPKPRKKYYNSPDLNDEWMPNATDVEREQAFKLRIGYKDADKNTISGTGPALYEYQEGPSTIQCWEFKNNGLPLVRFLEDYPGAPTETTARIEAWTGAFESRYPEYMSEPATDKRGFARLVNWLHSTNQQEATNEPLLNSQGQPTTISLGGDDYTADTKAYRLARFKAEIEDYMDLRMTMFYYIVTEAFLMVDSRAKNMMMCSCDCDMDAGTGHWFPIFYDMDTILGVDNKGMLRFPYDTDDANDTLAFNATANQGFYNDQGEWVDNPRGSVLWTNLREAFATDIAAMYNSLRNNKKFTYNYLSKSYDVNEATAYAEIYDNKDAKYKYIDPYGSIVEGAKDDDGNAILANYLYAAQGTRQLHREFFLKHRFALLDGKYPDRIGLDYVSSKSDIKMRLYDTSVVGNTHPDPRRNQGGELYQRFNLISQSTQYGVFQPMSAVALPPIKMQPETPTLTPSLGNATVSDQEAWLFYLGDIYDLGDMSGMYPSTFNIQKKLKLRALRFGPAKEFFDGYESMTSLDIGANDFALLPLLELLDIRKKKLKNAPNLSQCKYFQTLLASGSNIKDVVLPVGGNLKRLELPESIQGITIRDHGFYDTFHMILDEDGTEVPALSADSYANVTRLWIEGCPLVDTRTLCKDILTARTSETHPDGAMMADIRLPDLNWEIPATAEWCVFNNNVITDIPVVDFICRTGNGIGPTGAGATDNTYIAGTIRIKNGTDQDANNVGVDIYALTKKYNAMFPELEFVIDPNSKNITGYYINIYDINKNKIVARDGKQNSKVLGAQEITGAGEERFNFESYLSYDVEIPSRNTDGQYTYEFKGWSYDAPDAQEDPELLMIDIPVNVGAGAMAPQGLASQYLELSQFSADHEINLYPVFQKHLCKFPVWFYMREEGSEQQSLNPEVHTQDPSTGEWQPVLVEWGQPARVPTNEPTIITLDPVDKSKAMIQVMDHYDEGDGQRPLNRITSECRYYPVFKTAVRMNEVVDPPISYFDVEDLQPDLIINSVVSLTPGENACCATIKSTFTGEAVVVPLEIGGKRVVTIKNNSASVKRIYFEKDSVDLSSNILYFNGGASAGFAKSTNSDSGEANTTLEYIDFGACKKLQVIGGGTSGSNNTGEFCRCTSLYVPELPDSLIWIGGSAFRADPYVQFTKMPTNLAYIGQYAFRSCTGLGTVDCSQHAPDADYNPKINEQAFKGCTNLNFGTVYYFMHWKTIGKSAFEDCKALRAFNAGGAQDGWTLREVGDSAFKGCEMLGLNRLPKSLEVIGASAFQLGDSAAGRVAVISTGTIESTVKAIGADAFAWCRVQNDNGNGISWYLDTFETHLTESGQSLINANAFRDLELEALNFPAWRNTSAVYVDYDANRTPVWEFAKTLPWYDGSTLLVPFGAKTSTGASTPVSIQANGG